MNQRYNLLFLFQLKLAIDSLGLKQVKEVVIFSLPTDTSVNHVKSQPILKICDKHL